MTARFTDYFDAFDHACARARQSNHDVAIRRTVEFGKVGFNVALAAITDSDYALAEIVRPCDAVRVSRPARSVPTSGTES